jgi:futalosine hydrolase
MEGFGVAVACRLANVPLTIVRGISNRAGDRDHTNWNIEGSLEQAMQLILHKLLQTQEVFE